MTDELPAAADVAVIGAGIVGTAIGARLAASGVDVCVLDRGNPANGTSSAGEGNLLVSDKLPGPDLALALRGLERWQELAARAGGAFEFEAKGSLVVARDADELSALWALAELQRAEGVTVDLLTGPALRELEPAVSPALHGGVLYPQDCQVQPMLAVDFHVRELLRHGGRVVAGADVLAAEHDSNGAVRALRTTRGRLSLGRYVVNAAGPWAAEVARRLGTHLPVEPRRGHVLVTEPLAPLVQRKIYEAGYVGAVHEPGSGWTCSAVVEGTRAGTVLLGSSREFVGWSSEFDAELIAAIARRSVALVPALARARLMRAYVGFRPATPDRLPIIGPDAVVGGLLHATGHEGAGVGLAEVTAEIIWALVLGEPPPIDTGAFTADRWGNEQRAGGPAGWPEAPGQQVAGQAFEGALRRSGPRVAGARAGAGASEQTGEAAARTGTGAEVPGGAAQMAPGAGGRPVRFRFDGRELTAPFGTTVAGALWQEGLRAWRTTRLGGQPRGLFCGIGTCFDCLVDLNGERAVRACLVALQDGDDVRWSSSAGPGAAGPEEDGHERSGVGEAMPDLGRRERVGRAGASPGGAAQGWASPGGAGRGGAARGGAMRGGAWPGGAGWGGAAQGGARWDDPAAGRVDVVVVGAGPAGMAAASAAARRGARVAVVDSAGRLGGQYFRQPMWDVGASTASAAGPSLPARFHHLAGAPGVELLLGRSVWSLGRAPGGFAVRLDGAAEPVLYPAALVLATGATELTLPFPGWDLPGVVTAGAAQSLLKSQHVNVGRRVVVAGTGPFLWPVAAALAAAGARTILVEAAPARSSGGGLASLLRHPSKLVEVAGYAAVLARRGARLLTGRAVVRCEGGDHVERAVLARLGPDWTPVPGTERVVEADAVCVSYGFVPRLELARQLGAAERAEGRHPAVSVATSPSMSTSVPGLYAAGELTGVAGAEVAEVEGAVAGHGAASYLGLPDNRDVTERAALARRLVQARRFAARLQELYPIGPNWVSWLEPATTFCRCEQSTWGAVDAAVRGGASRVRDVRSVTRCGMGYCQARTCGPALQLAVSALTCRAVDEVGDLQKRPVAVPLPLRLVAGENEG
ncbi:MAG TPA: FAD-dependent oxidoreductase [Acidimicrobiales bacterium]|nr:FAD-dependent oxidoreductase [Acidimicrobiales bacterium]